MKSSFDSFVAATIRFSYRLFGEIARQKIGENSFISPLSIAMGLLVVLNGAGGDTKRELGSVLGMDGLDLDAINQAYSDLKSGYMTEASRFSFDEVTRATEFLQSTIDPVDERGYFIYDDEEALARLFGVDYREREDQARVLLDAAKQFHLHLINALWLKQDSQLNSNFVETCKRIFETQFFEQNVGSSGSSGVRGKCRRGRMRGKEWW